MIFNVTIFAANVIIETKIDELFSESVEPVSLNINVANEGIARTPVNRLNNKLGMVIMNDLFACGVPKNKIRSHSCIRTITTQ